ncbi:hypothetical protein PHAVU_002G168200 [Phaseolus vulgaris]|uniref:Uncharacterized protein n=1 Tax=Phaseolus vulgaris TaxID=3885 RepID=V7CNW9_PHAVU|nr:hypothetical protein PHAVU_002G168200g [Phaseolus vulgaris]ESW30616.1 hypothetical protein PHAVU_002G168200g [Phaseolus vulgaris]
MKISLSSLTIIIFFFFIIFFTTLPPQTSSTNSHYCDSFPHTRPRSLCIGLQRMHHPNSPPLPPLLDPRFASEKRRVPTGPNPLHN